MQAQIQQGKLIKSVTPTGNGIVIEMSDGQKFEINNGKNGADAPATVVEIGKNGNWFINGKDTGKPSQGAKGDKGDKGEQGEQGEQGKPGEPGKPGEGGAAAQAKYYKPGTDGYWYVVENGKETKTDMKWETAASQAGGIVAIKTGESLTLKNVQGAEDGMVKINLGAELKSMVFIPEFSLDGHEAMEYLYIPYKPQTPDKKAVSNILKVWNAANCDEEGESEIYTINPEYLDAAKFKFVYPYNHKPFHLNPANAILAETTPISMSSDDLEVEHIQGRGYDMTDPSRNHAQSKPDGKFVNRVKGDLIVGISMLGDKVKTQSVLPANDADFTPAWDKTKYYDYFAAINNTPAAMTQLAPSIKVGDLDVTSTYAAVKASQFAVAELAYNAKYTKNHAIPSFRFSKEEAYWISKGVNGGLLKNYTKHATPIKGGAHLYSSIQEAAEMPATLELVYTNDNGINLNELIDVHFISNSTRAWNDKYKVHTKHTTEELAYYDLHLEFELAKFYVGSNKTAQHAFAFTEKAAEGTDMILYPCDVLSQSDIEPDKWVANKASKGQGIAGVGKTPVVIVKLVNKAGEIVKVGYIKFKITAPLNPLETAPFDLKDYFYQCDNFSKVIAWHAISNKLYAQTSKFINTKSMFDRHYRVVSTPTSGKAAAAQFYNTGKKDKNGKYIYKEYSASEYVGEITLLANSGEETTDVFKWEISAADFQTVYNLNKAVGYVPSFQVQRLVKYLPIAETDGDAAFAKEPIYLPINVTLNYPQGNMSGKIDRYWFAQDSNIKSNVNLEKRNFLHVSIQVPGETVEGTPSTPVTPAIKFDLNSAFTKNENIGHAIANQTIDWNAEFPVFKGEIRWRAENAPAIDFTTEPKFNTAKNFADFQAKNLVYYYYFTAANNNKKVVDVNGNEHKLLVKNTLANSPIMNVSANNVDTYEYLNTEIYVDVIADANKLATIHHEQIINNAVGNKGQNVASYLELVNNKMSKLLLNNPKVWTGKNNTVDDLKMLQETLDFEIGVVAFNRCGLNFPLVNNKFGVEVLKPVYAEARGEMQFTDAVDGVKSLNIFDFINFYDWRTVEFGSTGKYYHFYGVESMTVDVDEIITNISGEMKPLKEVSGDVEFHFIPSKNGSVPAANATLAQLREHFGQLTYGSNNGDIVDEFKFEVPVKIKHYWSESTLTVWVKGSKVGRTTGN